MKNKITKDIIDKYQRKLSREIELERNGGRWKAVNRPHKNKKKYDRKKRPSFDDDLF